MHLRPAAADLHGFGLPVIEDAAQAFGAGGIATSVASTFSFFPTKNLFALGDGGLISVNDADLAASFAHAAVPRVGCEEGVPVHRLQLALDVMQAAFLRKISRHTPPGPPRSRCAVLRAARRDRRDAGGRGPHATINRILRPVTRSADSRAALTDADIGHSVYYQPPLHLQPAFAISATRKSPSE